MPSTSIRDGAEAAGAGADVPVVRVRAIAELPSSNSTCTTRSGPESCINRVFNYEYLEKLAHALRAGRRTPNYSVLMPRRSDTSTGNDVAGRGPREGASRLRVLQALQAADQGLGVRELAADVGLHTNTVRMHLDRLVAEGLVRRQAQDRSEPGRPPLTFTAVASGFHGDRRAYRLLAEMLASFVAEKVPDSRTAAIETGRMWGHFLTERPGPYRRADRQRSLDVLTTILDDIGFAPEIVQTAEA